MRSAHARFRNSTRYLTASFSSLCLSFSLPLHFSCCFSPFLWQAALILFSTHLSYACCHIAAARVSREEKNSGLHAICLTRITYATSILKAGWSYLILSRILISQFVLVCSHLVSVDDIGAGYHTSSCQNTISS